MSDSSITLKYKPDFEVGGSMIDGSWPTPML